jgi:stage III sporulation protein SpoIIIAA
MDKLIAQFSRPFQEVLHRHSQWLSVSREIRIRVGQPVLLCGEKDVRIEEFRPDAQALEELLLSLCGGAMYACEEQLREGFLTLKGGHRAGVCGRMLYRDGKPLRYVQIQSLNIRIARQMRCDRRAVTCAGNQNALRSVMVISPPGMGKTTLLREMARSLSIRGVQVSVADERGEIAASFDGVPQLDVGPCTDVMDAMPMMGAFVDVIAPNAFAIAQRLDELQLHAEVIVIGDAGGRVDVLAAEIGVFELGLEQGIRLDVEDPLHTRHGGVKVLNDQANLLDAGEQVFQGRFLLGIHPVAPFASTEQGAPLSARRPPRLCSFT